MKILNNLKKLWRTDKMTDKTMQEEMDEMEKSLEEPGYDEEDLRTDPPGTNAPGTSAPGTEAPNTDAPATEPPEEDPRDAEMRKLREEIDELKKSRSTSPPPTKAPTTEKPLDEEDFLGDVDLDELTRDPAAFNKVLNKVYKKGVEIGKEKTKINIDSLIDSIPKQTQDQMKAELEEVNKKFYDDNEDLRPWGKTVSAVFKELSDESPGSHYSKIIPLVADETRKRLGLKKPVVKKKGNGDNPPPLPKRGSQGRDRNTNNKSNQGKSDFDMESDEMDKALGL
jgi:hypothetical protein